MLAWGQASPERVLIGLVGRHDGPPEGERLAACLDCHVPFVGTPGSRCLGPGCHGELATGTPPRDGPAMPIRFHTALRDQPCSLCHQEHVAAEASTSTRTFTHRMIPAEPRARCTKCHSGAKVRNHPITDAVNCSVCHGTIVWGGTAIEHERVAQQPCDVCHVRPENETHASVAGNCSECHVTERWSQRPASQQTPPQPQQQPQRSPQQPQRPPQPQRATPPQQPQRATQPQQQEPPPQPQSPP